MHPDLIVSKVNVSYSRPYQWLSGPSECILMLPEISCKPSRKMTTDSKTTLAEFQSDSRELRCSRWYQGVGQQRRGRANGTAISSQIKLKAIASQLCGTNVKLSVVNI